MTTLNESMAPTTRRSPMNILYTATARVTGDGRNGHARSDDGLLDLELRVPTSMGGPGGATNPEQLFAAGYAACFHSALKSQLPATSSTLRAARFRLSWVSASSTAVVLASPWSSTCTRPHSSGRWSKPWRQRPMPSVHTRTPPAATSM